MNPAMLLIPKSQVDYLTDDNTVRQGLEKFKSHGFTAVPLISRSGKYLGTIRDKDFLVYILEKQSADLRELEEVPITKLLRAGFNPPVNIDTGMEQLFAQVKDQNFVPVVDSRGLFVGIITRKAFLSYIQKRLTSDDYV